MMAKDLRPRMLANLQGDRYADPDRAEVIFESEYAEVTEYPEWETPNCVVIHTNAGSYGMPPEHEVIVPRPPEHGPWSAEVTVADAWTTWLELHPEEEEPGPPLSAFTRAELNIAIWRDHPCEDYGCDIAIARRHGFTEAAAHLLTGATETPAVNAVIARFGLVIPGANSPEFGHWAAFHRVHGRRCPACESFMYADPDTGFEPATCSSCLAPLPPRPGPEPERLTSPRKNQEPLL